MVRTWKDLSASLNAMETLIKYCSCEICECCKLFLADQYPKFKDQRRVAGFNCSSNITTVICESSGKRQLIKVVLVEAFDIFG